MSEDVNKLVDKLMHELRRGTITIGVLSQLSEPQYGYSLVTMLNEKGVQVEPGTLYPLLRRLEKQGLLSSKWDTNESRPRKYYYLNHLGRMVYDELCVEWRKIVSSLDFIIEEDRGN
ncbi:PadR family transcriptional regulator [Tenuibacillus multivorans]|uniref:DNA-binding transcriptional regulator, PadR family n=1 Tax=Tenuibacillus multivorans TaxID=237069 RepID=A0A1G9WKN8_9BACI|nr:PadR family transcriptional regulator [Tenuibacillus multivorans]GEL76502.1 PadR family transcriptional regulator [Tenuibacillus multivorans]SDM85039.1 DNA-binding transcriptional regulator, PadR family [Tenuibacillus multivorans]